MFFYIVQSSVFMNWATVSGKFSKVQNYMCVYEYVYVCQGDTFACLYVLCNCTNHNHCFNRQPKSTAPESSSALLAALVTS